MAELFVDASGRRPKCYWRDYSCPKDEWYRIKTGPEPLFIFLLLLKPIIGLLFWALFGASLYWAISVTIFFMIASCFIYPHSEVDAVLQKSKKLEDILIENSPVYITVSKSLSSICFIIPEKKYMFFKTLRYGDDRLDLGFSGWYTYKNSTPIKIDSPHFRAPIEDLDSKLNYRYDLGSIVNLSNSPIRMKNVLKAMRDISLSVFNE